MKGSHLANFPWNMVRSMTINVLPARARAAAMRAVYVNACLINARLVINQRHFAENTALFDGTQNNILAIAVLADDLDGAILHHIGLIAFLAFLEHEVPGLKGQPVEYALSHQ